MVLFYSPKNRNVLKKKIKINKNETINIYFPEDSKEASIWNMESIGHKMDGPFKIQYTKITLDKIDSSFDSLQLDI